MLAIAAAVMSVVTMHWMVHVHKAEPPTPPPHSFSLLVPLDVPVSPATAHAYAYSREHIRHGSVISRQDEVEITRYDSTASSWVTYIGLLRAKGCIGGHGCKKVHLRGTDYHSFEKAGKAAFVLMILGTVVLLPALVYFTMNCFSKRTEKAVVHHCLRLHALAAAVALGAAWCSWLVVVPHPQGYHLGFSFALAVGATGLAVLAYVASLLVRDDFEHYSELA
ncbi:hypothetical protein Pelo_13371 [Pelomyxa schiedti]|nr:hypothetical protein Pelo_13371 [Pelomyxa schiedti]